jgi:ribosome-associated protein
MPSKQQLSADERALLCAELALDKKAEEVRILEISPLTTIADYMVLATGQSDKQVQAIAENIRTGLKKYGKVQDIEGVKEGRWAVIDYGDVIVHVFHEEMRKLYDMDGLWSKATRIEPPAPKPGVRAGKE